MQHTAAALKPLASSHEAGGKRQLAAICEQHVDRASWKKIFGVVDGDSTALESVKLKRVGVVGSHDSMATELVDCFAAKPSVVDVGVHLGPDGMCSKFDIMPGVTALPTAHDVCAWSDVIFLCCSYEDSNTFLHTEGVQKVLLGKCVLQLTSGTPEDALTACNLAETAGAKYLDAFVFSEGTASVFNHPLSAMMVSGDNRAWREVEEVVRAAAPASFYGGRRVEWANTVGVGVLTFLASVRMGLTQAQNITTKFGLPPHVLARVLNSGYMHVMKYIVTSAAVTPSQHSCVRASSSTLQTSSSLPQSSSGGADTDTFSDVHGVNSGMLRGGSAGSPVIPSSMHAVHGVVPTARAPRAAASGDAAKVDVGSAEWMLQLERIREVCRSANVDHSLIDGLLAASGVHHQQAQPATEYVPSSAHLAVGNTCQTPLSGDVGNLKEVEEPLVDVFGQGGVPEALNFDVREVLMDTDMIWDDCFLPGWAP